MSFSRKLMAGLAVLSFVFGVGGIAHADLRPYLVTYGYYTPEKGEKEIEQWTESFTGKDGKTDYRSRTELEYGVSDRLAAALYFVNEKPYGESVKFDETKLELRYRLTQSGDRFWDIAGYVELAQPGDSGEPSEIEMKAIFSHEFPGYNLTLNLIGEKEMESGSNTEFGYAIGIAPYQQGRMKYSIEAFGGEDGHYVMPALWISPGANQNIGVGLAAGLTHSSDRLQVRTMYAREF